MVSARIAEVMNASRELEAGLATRVATPPGAQGSSRSSLRLEGRLEARAGPGSSAPLACRVAAARTWPHRTAFLPKYGVRPRGTASDCRDAARPTVLIGN